MARDHEQTEAEATFVIRAPMPRRPPAATRGFAERLALFVSGVDRASAEELLTGLGEPARRRAVALEREAREWDSATRQGRMAVAFGNQPHASERLKRLVVSASPLMRRAIFCRLSPWQQSLFPALHSQPEPVVSPGMGELAARLIREATR